MAARGAAIRATGLYVPPIELTNDELRRRFESSAPGFVDKMQAVSGILTRWRAESDQVTSDLVVLAAGPVLSAAGLGPEDLDLIIVGTDSPDYITPATSVVVQRKMGATRAGTFDVGCACASFPTALATAAGLIHTNPSIKNILVAGAYLMSRLSDPEDPMSFFYGDGAGAVLVSASSTPGILGSAFQADGHYAERWGIRSGGTMEPASEASVREGRTKVKMYERYPAEINDEGWPRLVRKLLGEQAMSLDQIDHFIFTQVRKTTIEKVMHTLEQPIAKAHMVMDKWGYTGSACLPMAFHDARVHGRFELGQHAVLVGSGVGYNQAATLVRITADLVPEQS